MGPLIDDVGSFPLPPGTSREVFDRAYVKARETVLAGKDLRSDNFLADHFWRVVADSFRRKCQTGLDVVSYPQHYDMYRQFTDLINGAMENGTYVVEERNAILPEIRVIVAEAKALSEELGRRIALRVCVTGPLDLYLRVMGTVAYRDVLLMFAETVKRFARNAIVDTKYVKTEVVSVDEPSLGFQDVSADKDVLLEVYEKAFDFPGVTKQIHLHSPVKIADLLDVKNLDVLSFEFGASPKNIESVSKAMLEGADKSVRVGVSRTDIDAINAELHDKGVENPSRDQIVDSEDVIRKRFVKIREKFGDRLAFTGPDCGLGGWPSQESAELLLNRTVDAVKSVRVS